MEQNKTRYIWGLLRLAMGWIFFWAFIDKLFGFGFATAPTKAWIIGGSPTFGFLKFAVNGPFADFYHSIAGSAAVDWLFMLGLLFVGLALLFGVFVKLAASVGILMLVLMYTAISLPPQNNPFLDEHIIYILLMAGFVFARAGQPFGLGKWWSQKAVVKKYKILE